MSDKAFESLSGVMDDLSSPASEGVSDISLPAENVMNANMQAINRWRNYYLPQWRALKKQYKCAVTPDEQLKILWDEKKLLIYARDSIASISESAAKNYATFFGFVLSTLGATIGIASGALVIPGVAGGVAAGITSGAGMLFNFMKGFGMSTGKYEYNGIKNIPNQRGTGVLGKQMVINKINNYMEATNEKIQYVLAGKILKVNASVARATERYSEAVVNKVSEATDKSAERMAKDNVDYSSYFNVGKDTAKKDTKKEESNSKKAREQFRP